MSTGTKLISFLLIDIATQSIPKITRNIVFSFLAILAIFCWFSVLRPINAVKTENHYLSLPRGGIYITNSPSWITTVEETTEFLNKTLKPNIPYQIHSSGIV